MKKPKTLDYQKEQYRGTIKQIMKVRGLRCISFSNYNRWRGLPDGAGGIHSIKYDVQDGYINAFGFDRTYRNGRPVCSTEAIQDAPADFYKRAYDLVMEIISNEGKIPYAVKKNILVRVSR